MSTKRENLSVEKRTVFGKSLKKLRREGILPSNIYGKEFKSAAVQLPMKAFLEVFKKVHETGLIDVSFGNDTIPALIHNVQIDPRSQTPLHADFFKVNLKEKITAKVPLIAVGEAKAVIDKLGLLEQPVSEIEVEALPTDLPEKIEVNVEGLAQVDEQILVSEIKAPEGVAIMSDPAQVVFKIGELVTKEAEAEAAAEEAAAEAAAAESTEGQAPVEGETPAEDESKGEEKTEEAPKEEKPQEQA